VRVLEARFYPQARKAGTPVIVARVVWEGGEAAIQALDVSPSRIAPFVIGDLIERVRRFVDVAMPRPCEELTVLRSAFWSFVEVEGKRAET
jgi:hypothetical protein